MTSFSIRISPEVSQKYVLAKVSNSDQFLLWGNPKAEWHKDIAGEIEKSGFLIETIQGGKIKLLTDSKTIYVWGRSSVYGEAPFSEVKKALETIYHDYNILNEVPSEE